MSKRFCVLFRFENALKRHCATCCIPYVDTRLDCSLPRPSDTALFSSGHFGNNQGAVRTGMAANWRTEPRDCDRFGTGVLTRFTDRSGCWRGLLYRHTDVNRVRGRRSYDDLCLPYESSSFEVDHGGPHIWTGGHMSTLACAPLDPFFWSHHCFIDMLGELLHDRLPTSQWYYPRNWWWLPWRHRPDDPMRPFDYVNQDGMDNEAIGKEYFYDPSPAEEVCNTESDCGASGLLWCDMATGRGECKAKCRQGGVCNRGIHAMCYCETGTPRCDTGTCQCT